jgi:hypothetical protein
MDDVMEVKPYACPPWVARPPVVICEDKEQVQGTINDYRSGQVSAYTLRHRRCPS